MIGTTISHYQILEKLGEGGMGVVYKAQDTKLDRLVALKFLPEHVSAGSGELERFLQEAKAAAGLNHPNICTIHGIEEFERKNFIVMEYVDGQTLQEKKSSLSMKQALDVGIQIAEGLAAAHEKGIVHRDIKPENIMIRKDGRVQIMDFGLAKLRGASRLTKEGSTVGTAGYMSPEQVQGQETDHRSDIFSLGVLLYEMLAGQPPFKGVHETAIAYEIVNVDSPPLSSIKPEIAPELDAIVLECLEKDPKERTQSASQVAVDLKRFKRESSRSRMSRTMSIVTKRDVSARSGSQAGALIAKVAPHSATWIVAVLVLLGGLGWALWLWGNNNTGDRVNNLHIFAVGSPEHVILQSEVPCMALSPDGRMLVYALSDGGASQLHVRSLDNFDVVPLKGTINATSPFFSPDGQWIGFFAEGKIKKVPTAGGSVETLCDAQGFRGASWGPDDRIYYSPDFASAIMSISVSGKDIRHFSKLDTSKGERTHRWPQVLPGGKYILFTLGDQRNPNSYEDATLVVQSTENGEQVQLNVKGAMARYVEPGFLVVGRNASLLATPFSVNDMLAAKSLVKIIDGVNGDLGSGALDFAVSQRGDLVYLPGTLNKDFEVVKVTLDGTITPLALQPQQYYLPRFSPDGSKLAITMGNASSDNDIWLYDIRKETVNRLTFTKAASAPLWSKDGKSLYFADATSDGLILNQQADGSSQAVKVALTPRPSFPVSFGPHDEQLITSGVAGDDSRIIDLRKASEPEILHLSSSYSYGGLISPDGRYIMYGSTETRALEIFVRSFPDLKGKWQVSVGGGLSPVWAPDGKQIYYVSTVGIMMAVPVKTVPVFAPGAPKRLFDVSQMHFPNVPITNFDISPDGKSFVMIRNTARTTRTTSFNYIQNWRKELEKLDE